MEDPELAAIRAARMNQLQQESTGSTNAGNEEASKRAAEDEMRRTVLARILDHAARERRTPENLVSCPFHVLDMLAFYT